MFLTELSSGKKTPCEITPLADADYKSITKKRYSFNWKTEKQYDVYKINLIGNDDILGIMSLQYYDEEYRIQIRLIAVSSENLGKQKKVGGIAGNLIAYACFIALKRYEALAAVSLIPKTELAHHYITEYGFESTGKQLFLDEHKLHRLLKMYGYE
jgi:hypothetical protein